MQNPSNIKIHVERLSLGGSVITPVTWNFADWKKAFDIVDHIILMQKLEYYGIRGVCNEFKPYLSECKQFVSIVGSNFNHGSIIRAGVTCKKILL